jgi:enoyl-CoA hydratase
MTPTHLLVTRNEAVATITINRPDRLNALNAATIDELRAAVLEMRQDESVRTVIITGAGEKAFVAGADIAELSQQSPLGARITAQRGQHVFDLV